MRRVRRFPWWLRCKSQRKRKRESIFPSFRFSNSNPSIERRGGWKCLRNWATRCTKDPSGQPEGWARVGRRRRRNSIAWSWHLNGQLSCKYQACPWCIHFGQYFTSRWETTIGQNFKRHRRGSRTQSWTNIHRREPGKHAYLWRETNPLTFGWGLMQDHHRKVNMVGQISAWEPT